MKKKFTVLLLALTLALGACLGLTACGDKDKGGTTPKAITEGVFDGTYTGGGFKQDVYIRFHKTGDLVDGKQTFYYQAVTGEGASANVLVLLIGTYEVLDEEITLKAWQSGTQRAEDQGGVFTDRKADKTVVLKSLDGTTEYCRTGWDTKEDKLLGIPAVTPDGSVTVGNTMGVSTHYGNYCYLRKTDDGREDRKVAMATYYAKPDAIKNATITLYYGNVYEDNGVTGSDTVAGTYKQTGDGAYALTAGSGAKSGTLTVTSEKVTFTPSGESEIEMSNTVIRSEVYKLTSDTIPATSTTPVDTKYEFVLYDNKSVSATVKMASSGAALGSVEGTWMWVLDDNDKETQNIIVSLSGIETSVWTRNNDPQTSTFTYSGTITLPGGSPVNVTSEAYDYVDEFIVFEQTVSFTSPMTFDIDYKVTFYMDNSVQLERHTERAEVATMVNGVLTGTWTAVGGNGPTAAFPSTFTLSVQGGNDITGTVTADFTTMTLTLTMQDLASPFAATELAYKITKPPQA